MSAARKRPTPERNRPSTREERQRLHERPADRDARAEDAERAEDETERGGPATAKTKWIPCATTATSGQHLGRKEDLPEESAVRREGRGRVREGGREPVPREEPREEEERVGRRRRAAPLEDDREDERVDGEHEERVQERPEEPEDAAAVAGLQLAGHENVEERAMAPQAGEVLQHAASIPTRASYVG